MMAAGIALTVAGLMTWGYGVLARPVERNLRKRAPGVARFSTRRAEWYERMAPTLTRVGLGRCRWCPCPRYGGLENR